MATTESDAVTCPECGELIEPAAIRKHAYRHWGNTPDSELSPEGAARRAALLEKGG